MTGKVRVKIEKLIAGGLGLARFEGVPLFLPFVIPGEEVEAEILEKKKQYYLGAVTQIISPSASRREPECPYFKKCGGCDWLHIKYPEQVAQKALIVQEAFSRTGKISIEIPEIEVGPEYGYRNRVQFHTNSKGMLGFRKRKSKKVQPIKECAIAVPEINQFLAKSNTSVKRLANKKASVFGVEGNLSLFNSKGRSNTLEITLLGKSIRFNSQCFFQSNSSLLPDLIRHVISGYSGGLALDLYSGVGLFSLFLADHFNSVIGVEKNLHSAKFAKTNLSGESFTQFSSPVEAFSPSELGGPFDLVLVNPPRTGLSPEALDLIKKLRPSAICYVSCDPVTQARDARSLLENYEIKSLKLFDFYPQTPHVESVLKFERT